MALSLPLSTQFGVQLDQSYAKVSKVEIFAKDSIRFEVSFFASTDAAKTAEPVRFDGSYASAYDLSGENPIKQAYLHLKTLPEFSDAVDC